MNLSDIWGAKEEVVAPKFDSFGESYDAYAGCVNLPFEIRFGGKLTLNSPEHWKSLIMGIESWVVEHTDPNNPNDMFGLCDAWLCSVGDIENVMDGHAEIVDPVVLYSMGVGAQAFNRCKESAELLDVELGYLGTMTENSREICLKSIFGPARRELLNIIEKRAWTSTPIDHEDVATVWTTLLTRKRSRDATGDHVVVNNESW